MLLRVRKPVPAIGLEVGAESLKLLQLAADASGSLKVSAALRVAIPDGVKGDPDRRVAFAGEAVCDALRKGGFRGNRVVAVLPKELVHYKTHRLHAMQPEDVLAAARIDARDLFRFDPASADVQCIDAGEIGRGEDDRRREVILIAAGKKYLDQFTLALDHAGADVVSLDVDPCALWRAAQRVDGSVDAAGVAHPRVLLDVGAAQTRLVIGLGAQIRVVKTIDVGGNHLRTAIRRKVGLSEAEVEQLRRRAANATGDKLESMRAVLAEATRHTTELLAREVLACVRYHAVTFRGPAPRRIELLGGEAHDAQVRSALSATLLLPAKPADVFRGIDTAAIPAADRTAHLGEWAVVLGLALKSFPGRRAAASAQGDPIGSAAGSTAENTELARTAAGGAA